ncbi:CinA family protein [Kushneria sp. Sum13]|uniref:CinA family protein n=1 Tax=Kushneria sp. Sum13 TaxID=3459196 RepID=UPI004045BAC5
MAHEKDNMIEALIDYLEKHEQIITTAESCTAGLVISELASVPGSGQFIDSGLVVYSPEAKQRYLDIAEEIFEKHSLTSEVLSCEMARGALNNTRATIAVANTGIAGPAPSDDGTPIGTVCFAWAFRTDKGDHIFCETRRFDGGRNDVRLAAARHALSRICHYHGQCLNNAADA